MKKYIAKFLASVVGVTMAIGVAVSVANNKFFPVRAETATMAAGSNSSSVTVNSKAAIKCGTGSAAGTMTITLTNAGASTLNIYVGGWNNDTGRTVNVTVTAGVTISPTTFDVSNESGFSGSGSSFTVADESTHLKAFTLSNAVANTVVTFTAKSAGKNRYIAWGASYTIGSGGGGGSSSSSSSQAPATYTVTYNANNATSGSVPTDSHEYSSGDSVTVLGNSGALEKTNYTWSGWNTAPNGSGDNYNQDDTFEITANTTLYAKWVVTKFNPTDDGSKVTWDLSKASYETMTDSSATWESSKATISVDKASATTATNNYCPPTQSSTRFYTNSVLTITPANGYQINSIVFTATSNAYATALGSNSNWTNASASVNSSTVTVTPSNKRDPVSATIGAVTGHSSVVVNYSVASEEPSASLSNNSVSIKTNQNAGTTVSVDTDNIDSVSYLWETNDSNITLENVSSSTVTIKPNTENNGSATVTLTVSGTNGGNPITPIVLNVSVTITIPEPGETAGTAFTVAQAIESIDQNGDQSSVYVRGIISQIDSYSSQYKSINYWISDDGTTNNQFKIYSGKGLSGANFNSIEDIETGASVVVFGNITLYETTYEFSASSRLNSYSAAPRYTVAFNSLGGNNVDSISNIKKGTCVPSLPSATKPNDAINQKRYELSGWYTVADPEHPVFEEVNRFTISTPVNSSLTVYAKYNEISYYVVTFNTNGGNAIDSQNVDSGNTVVMPNNPTKPSDASYTYTFEGWYTNVGLSDPFNSSEPINSNLTVYAKYTAEAISNPGSYLNSATTIATLHANETTADSGTITKTINELATANNWTISSGNDVTLYTSFNLNANINISTTGTPNCGSVWGSETKDWRLYQNQNGNVIITASNGYSLTSVTFTYSVSNTGTLKKGDDTIASGSAVSLTGNTATFNVGNTKSATNGQVKITAISVSYERAMSVTNAAIRFGASIAKTEWDAINNHDGWQITDYGVMMMTESDLNDNHYASVRAAYEGHADSSILKVINKCAGGAEYADPYLDGDNYLFTVKVSFPDNRTYINDVIYAVPFVVVGEQYYFLNETHTSIHDLAEYYQGAGHEYLSNNALGYLMGN